MEKLEYSFAAVAAGAEKTVEASIRREHPPGGCRVLAVGHRAMWNDHSQGAVNEGLDNG